MTTYDTWATTDPDPDDDRQLDWWDDADAGREVTPDDFDDPDTIELTELVED